MFSKQERNTFEITEFNPGVGYYNTHASSDIDNLNVSKNK